MRARGSRSGQHEREALTSHRPRPAVAANECALERQWDIQVGRGGVTPLAPTNQVGAEALFPTLDSGFFRRLLGWGLPTRAMMILNRPT